jgi:hypothetical protein
MGGYWRLGIVFWGGKLKNKNVFFVILFAFIILSIISYGYLNQNPVRLFVLKFQANRAEAFRIDVYLNKPFSNVTQLHLNGSQTIEGERVLASENIYQMKALASTLGSFDFIIGVSTAEQTIDSFWDDFLNRLPAAESFGNLGIIDQVYLSLIAEKKLTAFNSDGTEVSPLETSISLIITPTPVVSVKTTGAEPTVRVEILNGCGIKGAANWVLSRISSLSVSAKNGGNATNFNYENSELLLSGSNFPNLEKVLVDLGFSKLGHIQSATIPAGYDAVFIVGKDFQMIKGN